MLQAGSRSKVLSTVPKESHRAEHHDRSLGSEELVTSLELIQKLDGPGEAERWPETEPQVKRASSCVEGVAAAVALHKKLKPKSRRDEVAEILALDNENANVVTRAAGSRSKFKSVSEALAHHSALMGDGGDSISEDDVDEAGETSHPLIVRRERDLAAALLFQDELTTPRHGHGHGNDEGSPGDEFAGDEELHAIMRKGGKAGLVLALAAP